MPSLRILSDGTPCAVRQLLPTAQQKLGEVARALKDDNKHSFDVIGYTDSTGTKEIVRKEKKNNAN